MTYDPNHPAQPALSVDNLCEAFDEMSARIRKNDATDFAGAFVIVTPDGKAKSTLLLDNSQSAAAFWGLLQSTAQIALQEIEDGGRMGQSYGRGR